jgi:hypothetical protein
MNSSRVQLRFLAGRVGSVRGGASGGLSWAAGCFKCESSAGAGWFRLGTLEWEREAAAGPDPVSSQVSA